MKSMLPLFILGSAGLVAADNCAPTPPTTCYQDDCAPCHCLGPARTIANMPVYPLTCNGDFVISVAGFYWNAHQDGMEYAIDNAVAIANPQEPFEIHNLIDAEYKTPNFKWEFGFKLGLGYHTTCDGWDIGATWTSYRGKASSHNEAETDDNHVLIALWSAFNPIISGVNVYATDIQTNWKLSLDLVDVELGRKFWVSHYLAFRPFMGIRFGRLYQDFTIQHKGGSWSAQMVTAEVQPALNGFIDLDNNFKGAGLRSGFDLDWRLGCGFALYSNLAASILYGRFDIDHDESNRLAQNDHSKFKVLQTEDHFHASRAIFDLALGIQWSTLFCDCAYGFTIQLGYEQHIFLHQNQMWRVERKENIANIVFPNNGGENDHEQRRGTLSTEGVTLTLTFEF